MRRLFLIAFLWSTSVFASAQTPLLDDRLGLCQSYCLKWNNRQVTFLAHEKIPISFNELPAADWFDTYKREMYLRKKYADYFLQLYATETAHLTQMKDNWQQLTAPEKKVFETRQQSLQRQYEEFMHIRWGVVYFYPPILTGGTSSTADVQQP